MTEYDLMIQDLRRDNKRLAEMLDKAVDDLKEATIEQKSFPCHYCMHGYTVVVCHNCKNYSNWSWKA